MYELQSVTQLLYIHLCNTYYMKTISLILLAIGISFLVIQNTFFGQLDADGVIQDSLFLPLGTFAVLGGLALLAIIGATALAKKMRRKRDHK